MSNYEKCIKQMWNILEDLRHKYPRMWLHFFTKNILKSLGISERSLQPSKGEIVSEKKFKTIYLILKDFKPNNFITRLLNKEDLEQKKV